MSVKLRALVRPSARSARLEAVPHGWTYSRSRRPSTGEPDCRGRGRHPIADVTAAKQWSVGVPGAGRISSEEGAVDRRGWIRGSRPHPPAAPGRTSDSRAAEVEQQDLADRRSGGPSPARGGPARRGRPAGAGGGGAPGGGLPPGDPRRVSVPDQRRRHHPDQHPRDLEPPEGPGAGRLRGVRQHRQLLGVRLQGVRHAGDRPAGAQQLLLGRQVRADVALPARRQDRAAADHHVPALQRLRALRGAVASSCRR